MTADAVAFGASWWQVAALACFVAWPVRAAPVVEVPVTVRERSGAAQVDVAVRVGIPLPRGVVNDRDSASIVDGERAEPAQTRVVSRWADGSVRWLVADFPTDLAPSEQKSLQLRFGNSPSPARRVVVERVIGGLRVDTGALRLVLPEDGNVLLRDVVVDGRVRPYELRAFAVVEGRRHAAKIQRVEILEGGPLRTRVSVSGSYGAGLVFIVRLDLTAGSRQVRLLHSIENRGKAPSVTLAELGVDLRWSEGPARFSAGREGQAAFAGEVAHGRWFMEQSDAGTLAVDGRPSAGRASGRLLVRHTTDAVELEAPFFWQEYPRAFEIQPGNIRHYFRSTGDGVASFGVGAAKTHALRLTFDPPASIDPARPVPVEPVLAVVDPAWAAASGALRNALGRDLASLDFLDRLLRSFRRFVQTQDLDAWDDSGRVTCSDGAGKKRIGAYGMFHWGDWNFVGYRDTTKGCDAWANLEYDTTQVLALGYVASGDPQLFEWMTAAARHFMDVDRIHHDPRRPEWVGMHHPKNPMHFTFELGGVDLGHVWNEGLINYGLLTGDERALRAATEIADYLVRRRREGIDFRGNPRQWGWPQVALVAAYELTGTPQYREAAGWYATRGMAAHAADAANDWKLGILAEGLTYTEIVLPRADIAAWLETYRRSVLRTAPSDPRFYPALAMAADESTRQRAIAVAAGLRFGAWGKPLTIAGRVGLSILGRKSSR